MKNYLLLFLLLSATALSAQTYSVNGKVLDDSGQPLPSANVQLLYPWGENATVVATEANGEFTIPNVEKGGYVLLVSYLGFDDLKKEVTVSNKNINMGQLKMTATATQLGEVTVKDKLPLGKVDGDTMAYNADAFKVLKDASAQDLIEKIPTVTVENGQVKAQGDNVQQVLVDGKPFFGNDPSAALKNLPAEIIEKVQVFDQQSEQSQFTGISDGNTTKTINIVTKKGMNNGQFGKVYAGYGWEDKYQAGGNVNVFKGARRLSFIGMSNNINVQNFSMDDILGVTGNTGGSRGGGGRMGGGRGGPGGGGAGDFLVQSSGGISTTHAFGLNYSDKWGKKVEVSGSYFFNNNNNTAEQVINRQFVQAEGLGEVYDETTLSDTKNTNHRLNFRATVALDSFNSLVIRPRATWQLNDGESSTLGATALQSNLLSSTDYNYHSKLVGLNFSNSLLWRHKFAKDRRTFSVDLNTGYAPKSGDSNLDSYNGYFYSPTAAYDTLRQQSTLDVGSWNASVNFEYTEPVGEYSQLMFNYKPSYQQEESDKHTFDFNSGTQSYDLLNEQLTNVFSNDYHAQSGGVGYNFSRGRELNWNVRANYQWAELNNQPELPAGEQINRRFSNILPSAMFRFNVGQQKQVRLFYRTNTQLPSVDQLQNVVDNSSPLLLKAGNPNLGQSFQHNLFFRYQSTNTEKATVFFAMLGGGLTDAYIAKSTWLAASDAPIFDSLDVQPGAQVTLPVNLDGYRNVRSFVNYGFPLKPIKSTLNLNASWNYARTPGLLNGEENFSNSHSFSTAVVLSSNISDKLDFNISLRPSWNRVVNTLQTNSNTEYLNQNTSFRFNWVVLDGLVFRTDLTHQYYDGLSESFNQNYLLWNLAIGKKVFKNERGELSLAVNDVLKQNRNIARNVTETYIEDTRTNALTRFVMLSFTYNIRNFGTAPASQSNPERRPWDGGGMPPPPGGRF